MVHWGDWQRYLSYYCLVTRLECGLLLSGDNETHEWSALAWRSKGVFLLPFGRGPACSGFASQTHGSHKTEFEMKKKTVQDALFPWLSMPAISLWKFCRVKVAELFKISFFCVPHDSWSTLWQCASILKQLSLTYRDSWLLFRECSLLILLWQRKWKFIIPTTPPPKKRQTQKAVWLEQTLLNL